MTLQLDKSHDAYRAGREHMDRGDYSQAIPLLEQSIAAGPHFKTLELLGECKLRIQDPMAAIVPLAAAVGLGTNEFRATYLLAEAYLQLGDKSSAKEYVERALQMRPDFKRASDLRERLNKT